MVDTTRYIQQTVFMCMPQNTAIIADKWHCSKIWKKCVSNVYHLVLIPVFDQT